MKLVLSMLAEYLETTLSAEEIADQLTMLGFEVEAVQEVEGEPVLDVSIMANRGDAASVLGLARELQAKLGGGTSKFIEASLRSRGNAGNQIKISSSFCNSFALLTLDDVQNGPSPAWLQKRLRQMGQRPISLLVDLTNYVMLEVGQPMHAYDADRLQSGSFTIREAAAGELLTTLDGVERTMSGGELLIAEGPGMGKPVALAGIIGGLETEVHSGTKRALIEAARFDAQSVRRTRKSHGLFTEASYRFEREVDASLISLAFRRFATLYREISGRECDASQFELAGNSRAHNREITLRPSRASRLLGCEVTEAQCESVLKSLGCNVGRHDGTLLISAPSWRYDLSSETDLIEEVGRVFGYQHIPSLLPQGTTQAGGLQGYELWRDQVRHNVIAEGFTLTIGHSLVAGGALMAPDAIDVGPRQPASPEHRILRSSLFSSLAMSARRNTGRDLSLFEIGKVFTVYDDGGYNESEELAFLMNGGVNPPDRKHFDQDMADFYVLKGTIERLSQRCGFSRELGFAASSEDPRFHPTRQAKIEPELGVIGQIHPEVARVEGLPPQTILASLRLSNAYEIASKDALALPLSRHPAIRRDLAIVADRHLPFSKIEGIIRTVAAPNWERLWVFDLYEGSNIEAEKRSLGVALILRKFEGTFTDEEANRVRDEIAQELEEIGAKLRVG